MTDDIYVDLRAAGLPTPSSKEGREDLAKQLGFSYSHLDNVMSARKPYVGRLRDAINRLISKYPAPLSPLNKDEPDPVVEHVLKRAEPEGKSADHPGLNPRTGAQKFFYIPGFDGSATVVGEIAYFRSEDEASRYCAFLNKEAE